MKEIVIDSFAGGGGTSEGIKAAIGRDPDIAVNHDRFALAMHRINHPETHHLVEDVTEIDSIGMCAGQPVGMLWMSPDCKDHSKAKGGKPRDKNIRGLAWSCFGWVKKLPRWQRPRVVFLENVEEFQDWAPLTPDGKRCPIQKGSIFKEFVKAWEALGYVVEWRERRAWWSGAATIRKRLYMVMRCDGEPIVWPERTHGNPNDAGDAALIAAGQLQPWRTAADIIDFSLPCPSIFDTSAEIKAKLGIRANRPLAENTMARVAKGTMRYVVNAAKPFVVKVNHTGRSDARDRDIDAPLGTVTGKRDDALVTPFVTYAQQGGGNRDAAEPLHTITASAKDQNAIVTPFVTKFVTGSTGHAIDEPVHTITAHASDTHDGGAAPMGIVAPVLVGCGGRAAQTEPRPGDEPILTQTAKADLCLVAPVLTSYYGPGQGSTDRSAPTGVPLATDTAGGNRHGLVTPFLVPRYGERTGQEPRTRSVEEPAPVIVPTGNEGSLAAVHLSRQFGASVGSDAQEPVGTITAGGAGKAAVVAAFLAQHNGGPRPGAPAHSAEEPLSTIATAGAQQQVVAASMLNMRGSDRRDASAEEPLRTASAGGNHAATVYAFLAKYFGTGLPSQSVDEPLHTVSTKPRHGLVTVTVAGVVYAIVDIGMRMLTPRERFNAQGFRADYIIDRGILEDGSPVSFTLEQQGYMCGNSVCPSEAEALVAANYQARDRAGPKRPAPMPMFLEAAE
ncbi:DNA methyltransferase [Bosea sp. Root670]|uniref:DNA cytosine methyltransferase n=1 Tax=Bosea sp. Root670 TaxID=1736583 RepID=UPI000715A33D|nr:DNA methyltransferase [Bosea sp. Root670]